MAAIKLFLEYVAGKPEDEELRERIEQLEAMFNDVEQNWWRRSRPCSSGWSAACTRSRRRSTSSTWWN